jgi:hypothetical protein
MDVFKGVIVGVVGFFICIFLLAISMVYVVDVTIGDADFMVRNAAAVDYSLLLEDIMRGAQPNELPENFLNGKAGEINRSVRGFVARIIQSVYGYLDGKIGPEEIKVPLWQLFDELRPLLAEAEYNSLRKQGQNVPKKSFDKRFDIIWRELMSEIPDTLEFDEKSLTPEDLHTLYGIRDGYRNFHYAYLGFILFFVVFCAIIFFVDRNIPLSLRHVGIMLVITGLLQVLLIILLHSMGTWTFVLDKIPKYLKSYAGVLLAALGDSFFLTTILYLVTGGVFIGASVFLPRIFPPSESEENLQP